MKHKIENKEYFEFFTHIWCCRKQHRRLYLKKFIIFIYTFKIILCRQTLKYLIFLKQTIILYTFYQVSSITDFTFKPTNTLSSNLWKLHLMRKRTVFSYILDVECFALAHFMRVIAHQILKFSTFHKYGAKQIAHLEMMFC